MCRKTDGSSRGSAWSTTDLILVSESPLSARPARLEQASCFRMGQPSCQSGRCPEKCGSGRHGKVPRFRPTSGARDPAIILAYGWAQNRSIPALGRPRGLWWRRRRSSSRGASLPTPPAATPTPPRASNLPGWRRCIRTFGRACSLLVSPTGPEASAACCVERPRCRSASF